MDVVITLSSISSTAGSNDALNAAYNVSIKFLISVGLVENTAKTMINA